MVDVHAGVFLEPFAHHGKEVDEGLALARAVVRPVRGEIVPDGQHAPQVLESPLVAVDRPERVALEVEEEIALVRVGQHHQRLGVEYFVGRLAVHPVGDLKASLRRERIYGARRQFGHWAGVAGQVVQRAHPGVDEPSPLGDPHAGNEQQVVVLADLDVALGAAEAGPHPFVLPRHRGPAGEVAVQQPLQRGPPR